MNLLCLAPTYGRPRHILENTLACFERQTHPSARRRLMLLDDGGNVAPQRGESWELFASPERLPSLPAKYNAMLAIADRWWPEWEAVCVWDDDDVYLPHHVEAHAWALAEHRWSHPREVLSTYGTEPGQPLPRHDAAGRFHGSLAIRRDLLEEIGGWIETDRADFDQQQIAACQRLGGDPGRPEELRGISYVFRWADTGASHAQHHMVSPDFEEWYQRNARTGLEGISGLVPRFDEAAVRCLVAAG